MKSYRILYMLILLIFVSCSENKEARELFAKVESVMEEHPDSALAMLDSAYSKKGDWNTSQQIRYELLRAKAQNKAYVDFTTDSIMLKVAEYYDAHGTPNEQMEAHYLLGCTYRDMHEAPMALSCYLDATEKADTLSDDCDYRTLMRIWGQVADEFDRQAMPYKELEALKKYQDYAINCADSFNYIVGIELETRPYLQLKDTASAIKSQDKSFQLFKKHNLESDAARSIANLIPILLDRRQIHDAKMKIDFFESVSGLFDSNGEIGTIHSRYYYNKGYYYLCVNKLDSAEYFYRKLLKHDYLLDAYKGLLSVFKLIKNADSINKYSVLEEEAFVKSYSRLHTQAMFNADGLFNYSRNQRIALEKEKEANRNLNIIYVGSICSLFLLVILYIRYSRAIRKREKENDKVKMDYLIMQERYKNTKADLKLMEQDYSDYIRKKELELEEVKSYINDKEFLDLSVVEQENVNRIMECAEMNIFLNALKPGCADCPKEKDWSALTAIVMKELPIFYAKITKSNILSKTELQATILTRLGMSTTEISFIMGKPVQRITNLKTFANRKLFNENGAKGFYNNLLDL